MAIAGPVDGRIEHDHPVPQLVPPASSARRDLRADHDTFAEAEAHPHADQARELLERE